MRIFQTDLVERVQAARDNVDARENLLGIMIGQREWLLDLHEIGEIVPMSSVSRVPLTQDWYLGLLNIRGNLVSVIDFARYQGLNLTDIEPGCRVITFSPSLGINCGLLVTRIMGLRNIAEMQPQPDKTESGAPWVGQGFRDSESRVWTRLSLASIAQEQRFLHIGL